MAGTETVSISTKLGAVGGVRRGANQLALIAPLDAAATIAANTVKKYRRASDAETDHGTGSKIAGGVKAALNSGVPFVYAVGCAAKTGSPFTETFGASSAVTTGTLANLPVTSITSCTRDGTALTSAQIKYTHLDPTSETVAAGEILINTKSGKWKSGTATSGAGAGMVIVYAVHDWTSAFAQIDLEPYEVHTIPGYTYEAKNYGVWDNLVTHANSENKVIATALATGVTPASVETFIEATRTGRLFLLAAKYTGDLTSSIAAAVAREPVNGSMKEVEAPAGATFTGSYVRADYGDEATPANGTFHEMGCNAVYKDFDGSYRITNDRASTALTNNERFFSTRRSIRFCEVEIEDALIAVRRKNSTAIPFTEKGLRLVRSVLQSVVGGLQRAEVIDSATLVVPAVGEVNATDKTNRKLAGLEVNVNLPGQVHMFALNLNVEV